jgi:GldH lipoprotein
MRKNKLFILLVSISWFGCNDGHNYAFEHDFGTEMLWKDPVVWDWKVQKNDYTYTLKMDLQCAVHYPFDILPLQWTETTPEGETITHELDVVIRNKDGSFNGDKALDYLNFDIVLDDNHAFPIHGNYHYEMKPLLEQFEAAPFMVELEVVAEENKNH